MYRAGDRLVMAENCAHQLCTGNQGFSIMVLEVWLWSFGFLRLQCVCVLGFGLESGLSIGDGGNLCAALVLSSLTTDRYSIKVIMV